MSSMERKNRLPKMIRLAITISMARQNCRTALGRLYRQTMMTRHASLPRLASMKGMTREIRMTRMVRLTRLRSLIRG